MERAARHDWAVSSSEGSEISLGGVWISLWREAWLLCRDWEGANKRQPNDTINEWIYSLIIRVFICCFTCISWWLWLSIISEGMEWNEMQSTPAGREERSETPQAQAPWRLKPSSPQKASAFRGMEQTCISNCYWIGRINDNHLFRFVPASYVKGLWFDFRKLSQMLLWYLIDLLNTADVLFHISHKVSLHPYIDNLVGNRWADDFTP